MYSHRMKLIPRTTLYFIIFVAYTVAIVIFVASGTAFAAETALPVVIETASIPWWVIITLIAGVIGEILSLIPSLKSNGIVQLLLNIIKTVLGKKE